MAGSLSMTNLGRIAKVVALLLFVLFFNDPALKDLRNRVRRAAGSVAWSESHVTHLFASHPERQQGRAARS